MPSRPQRQRKLLYAAAALVAACSAVPNAAAAERVSIARPAAVAGEPLRGRQYGLDRIQVERAWTRARGAGVAIAVLDTGVDLEHEDLRAKLVAGHDFVDGDDRPQDTNGHGTHVAGIAAAATDNGIGVAGTAPAALVLPVRVLDAQGTGVESSVASGIDFAVRRAAELGVRLVVNLSLTDLGMAGGGSSRRIEEAVRRAWQAGAVVVAAVGNESLPFSEYPAAGPNVIAVGATDERNRRASFSNRGPTVVAPGDRIVSTYWDPSTPDDHDVYASGTGTSMAAPFVSGIAAMLLSSGLTNRQTIDRIVESADDLGRPGRDDDYGFGLVDAARALGLPEEPGVAAAGSPGPVVGRGPVAEAKFEAIEGSPSPVRAAPERSTQRSGRGVVLLTASGLSGLAVALALVRSLLPSARGGRETPWEA